MKTRWLPMALVLLVVALGSSEGAGAAEGRATLPLAPGVKGSSALAPPPASKELGKRPRALSAATEDESGHDWKRVSDKDGVKVWVKEVPGQVSTVRASGVIDAPPERVLAVLADVAAYAETMPHTEESRLVKREGNDIWMYSLINPPLGAKRDYAVKITLREEADGTLGTSWVAANEVAPPVKKGVVRVEENEGSWTLTPLEGGTKTGAVYILRVNPGGSVPKWIADKTNRTSVPDAFKAVRKAATSKRYANAPSPLAATSAPGSQR